MLFALYGVWFSAFQPKFATAGVGFLRERMDKEKMVEVYVQEQTTAPFLLLVYAPKLSHKS